MKKFSKLVLFVHGLGGSTSTWGKFDELIKADTELAWDVAHFEYPTPSLGLRIFPYFQSTYQPIQVLADALRTVIDERYHDYEEIALVGHSLGGLVIRKYVLTEVQTRRKLRVQKVVLYAVPNDGSALAAISRELSIGANGHVKQLCRKSEFLENLRIDWARTDVDSEVDITVVVGGDDRIVTLASAEGNFRSRDREPKIIINAGHKNIAKPTDNNDLRYIVLKNALKKKRSITQGRLFGSCLVKEWARYKDSSALPFQVDEVRAGYLQAIAGHFGKVKQVIRVTGLSGLGKTRLVYEAACIAVNATPDILYYDAAQDNNQLLDWLRVTIPLGKFGTLIVDNCSVALHAKLQQEVERSDSHICLITIDYSSEKTTGATMIRVERFKDEFIDAMLSPIYKGHIDEYELNKIVRFAQGFPRLAVMLAEARLTDDGSLGTLNDDLIARKLLWGNEEPSPEFEKILQGCALFDHFGLEAEVNHELKFIADVAVGVNEEKCYECIQHFAEKGLIDRRGRYAQLVPKPLAVRLAAQWWRRTRRERQLNLISELPEEMEGSFCAQIARLDFLPEVKTLTEELCGIQGPFGRAEVILSKRGSALFRALVEINPSATSALLERVLSPLSVGELATINGDTRRNLVWALEKLSFRRETFTQAAYSLIRLASGENESWSNNATGVFSQLFRIHASGTAAKPNQRFEFIRNALSSDNKLFAEIIAQALGGALDLSSGFRTVGAEYQGSAPPLEEWRPAVWQEIFDYLDRCIEIICYIFDKFPIVRPRIFQIFGSSIRSLVGNGRIAALDLAIQHIVQINGHHWPQALESIKDCLAYDQERISQEGKDALNRWARLLGGETGSLVERIKILVLDPPYEHRELEDGEFVDVAQANVTVFAKELAGTSLDGLIEVLPMLLASSAHRQTFSFGRSLSENLENPLEFVKTVISAMALDHRSQDVFLRGLLHGIFSKSKTDWYEIIDSIEKTGSLDHLYPQLICTGEISLERLMHAKFLVEMERTSILNLRVFSYGSPLRDLSPVECGQFAQSLLELENVEAPWVALDMLFMYCHGDVAKQTSSLVYFEKIVLACNIDSFSGIRDIHQWTKVCGWLLKSGGAKLAISLMQRFLSIIVDQNVSGPIRDNVGLAIKQSLEIYPKQAWPLLRQAITESEGVGRLHLLWLFESKRSFSSNSRDSLIDAVPQDFLIDWCRSEPEIAPYFIARTINMFIVENDSLRLNGLVEILLDEFEDSEHNVSSELVANMHTRSWSGSLVPVLERDKAAIAPLSRHPSKAVSTWALQQIATIDAEIGREKVRDAEQEFRWQ